MGYSTVENLRDFIQIPGESPNTMPTTTHKDEVTLRGLLRAVKKLSWDDFQEFINRALALQPPAPKPPQLSRRETTLLLKVNSGPPAEWHREYKRLIEKRRSHGLSSDEQRSLLKLVAKMERYDVKRMEWLSELANLRQLPLRALIRSLGLKTPDYV